MKKHYRITVEGKVQGVFYRASTKKAADTMGVKGLVKNEPDGKVYIEAEADAEALQKFIDWCRKGPEQAEVSNVIIIEAELKYFDSFEVRR